MKDKIISLITLRFESSNKLLEQKLLSAKEKMSARGLLNSSMTVQKCHAIIESEIKNSKKIIIQSIIDVLRNINWLGKRDALHDISKETLKNRKNELESIFNRNVNTIVSGLQNNMNFDSYNTLDIEEMKIELNTALDEYQNEVNDSLSDIIIKRFKNYKIVAILSIVFIIVISLAAFIDAFKVLKSAF